MSLLNLFFFLFSLFLETSQEPTRCPLAIKRIFKGTPVCLFTGRGQFLLAEPTLTTTDAERCHNPLAGFDLLNLGSHLFHDPTELMAENVALLNFGDNA